MISGSFLKAWAKIYSYDFLFPVKDVLLKHAIDMQKVPGSDPGISTSAGKGFSLPETLGRQTVLHEVP